MRYKITIEYDGTNYSGWQKQKNELSIQEVIEHVIFLLSNERVEVNASGRTDAGVHAKGQVAHFDLKKEYKEYVIVEALNHYLKQYNLTKIKMWLKVAQNNNIYYSTAHPFLEQDIVIKKCEIVNETFHARFSAKMRYYRYIILNSYQPSALYQNKVWHIKYKLNIDNMRDACQYLLGKNDFSSFRDSDCQANSPIKTIDFCNITIDDDLIYFDIQAKSFLHHMIRNIIGTLKDVGTSKITVQDFKDIINKKDRKSAGVTAPACGLYFMKVDY